MAAHTEHKAKDTHTEEHHSLSHTTTDHDEIRQWVEKHDGFPARVKGTEDRSGGGLLRIEFNRDRGQLEEISWEEFFQEFEDSKLAFLYQEHRADGSDSHFNKLVQRHD